MQDRTTVQYGYPRYRTGVRFHGLLTRVEWDAAATHGAGIVVRAHPLEPAAQPRTLQGRTRSADPHERITVLQKIRRASALAAVPAALALAVAAPASADQRSEPVAIGTAYEVWDMTGGSATLHSDATTCTDIPVLERAGGARNNANSGYAMRFYVDSNCRIEMGPGLNPGQSATKGDHNMNFLPVTHYMITPV